MSERTFTAGLQSVSGLANPRMERPPPCTVADTHSQSHRRPVEPTWKPPRPHHQRFAVSEPRRRRKNSKDWWPVRRQEISDGQHVRVLSLKRSVGLRFETYERDCFLAVLERRRQQTPWLHRMWSCFWTGCAFPPSHALSLDTLGFRAVLGCGGDLIEGDIWVTTRRSSLPDA